jgi:glyoxylase I family protein
MFKRIDHIELVTAEPERMVTFYTDILGFSVRYRDRIPVSPLGVPMDLVYLDLGGSTVELMSYPGASVAPAPALEHLGYRMMALEVADMEAALAYLAGRGIAPSWGPKIREKYARAEITDPDGNAIELRQWK